MPNNKQRSLVAIIPAAGTATRISPLPCSKEIYPLGLYTKNQDQHRPKAVCEYLLEKLGQAGITRVLISLRKGKWDIPDYLGDGSSLGLNIGYVITEQPWGAPYTIDSAYEFIRNDNVALGFPDIIIDADNAFSSLIDRQSACQADVVLGLFPGIRPDKADMVAVEHDGSVSRIEIKSADSSLKLAWGIALWTPRFTQYLHHFLLSPRGKIRGNRELFVGDVLQAAIDDGLKVNSVQVDDHPFLDIGTPEDLQLAIHRYATTK
jgi:glucose-1-phosphate thymidylyltransferase